MNSTRFSLVVLVMLLLNACAVFEPRPTEEDLAAERAVMEAAERRAIEAELEAQRVEQERLLAEERAREAAAARVRAEAEEAERREAAERQTRAEAERRQQQQERSGPSVEERAQAVARQQERIAELRAQIATTQLETTNLEAANAALLQAITAAEDLVATLTGEQEKYSATDPATGATVQPLSKERIEELSAELERLQNQAAALSQRP